jgi:hypothetical protein
MSYGGFLRWGYAVPQNGWFTMENPVELLALMILGNTYFNTFNKSYHI